MKLIIASNNKNKVKEYKSLLSPLNYEVISQSEAGISLNPEENGETFEENARVKARAIYEAALNVYKSEEASKIAVIADDSGLEVDFLNNAPGVYSARYAEVGKRKNTILEKLKDVPKEKRNARFVCVIHYINKDGEKSVRETCEGYIGFEKRGDNGFGYDPIFMYGNKNEEKSFAELSEDEKNEVSHRGKALRKLVEVLNVNE